MKQPNRNPNDAADMTYIKSIKAKYEAVLMQKPIVTGVGIGLSPEAHRRLVLVINVSSQPTSADDLPVELDGVPVLVKLTGHFSAHSSSG